MYSSNNIGTQQYSKQRRTGALGYRVSKVAQENTITVR